MDLHGFIVLFFIGKSQVMRVLICFSLCNHGQTQYAFYRSPFTTPTALQQSVAPWLSDLDSKVGPLDLL
jgi:hypothetical protein